MPCHSRRFHSGATLATIVSAFASVVKKGTETVLASISLMLNWSSGSFARVKDASSKRGLTFRLAWRIWASPADSITPEPEIFSAGNDDSNQSSAGNPTLSFPCRARAGIGPAGSTGKFGVRACAVICRGVPPRAASGVIAAPASDAAPKPASRDSVPARAAISRVRTLARRRLTSSFNEGALPVRLTDRFKAPEFLSLQAAELGGAYPPIGWRPCVVESDRTIEPVQGSSLPALLQSPLQPCATSLPSIAACRRTDTPPAW